MRSGKKNIFRTSRSTKAWPWPKSWARANLFYTYEPPDGQTCRCGWRTANRYQPGMGWTGDRSIDQADCFVYFCTISNKAAGLNGFARKSVNPQSFSFMISGMAEA